MLNIDRQRIILDQLYQKGSVKVSELSKELGFMRRLFGAILRRLRQNGILRPCTGELF